MLGLRLDGLSGGLYLSEHAFLSFAPALLALLFTTAVEMLL